MPAPIAKSGKAVCSSVFSVCSVGKPVCVLTNNVQQPPAAFINERMAAGVSYEQLRAEWEGQVPPPPREIDEPGFTLLRFAWTAPGWKPG